jgi:hypothetical protein
LSRDTLDWATPQNNLGTALPTLKEQESGTARLEEAVAAYRAALEEMRTRGRVEDGRGGLRRCQSLRFPSPLIKADVRVSRIRLSDWFCCKAHGGNPAAERREPGRSCRGGISVFHGLEPYAAD